MPRFVRFVTVLAAGAAALALIPEALAERPFSFETTPGKLPKEVRPVAYRINLDPDLQKLSFTATEEVDIDVAKPTDTITVNAVDLKIASASLKGESLMNASAAIDGKAETVTFRFPRTVQPGRHTLAVAYSGPITQQPSGLYYADYETKDGKKRMLTTQFEATDARRMFPGWDEPAFKATFTLSAILPKDFRAISNMPVAQAVPVGADRQKVTFATTPKMSSYLVVLSAGELDRISTTAAGVDIGVDMVTGKTDQGRYALRAASQILPYYNDYFGVEYPLPKLDLIAIPGNFAAGAMENWGGITYIDSALLYDPKTSSAATKQYVYLVIAHEMAHQWSGDLVTMAWWDNIWLNEGFAAWMENKATDHFNPDWHIWLRANDDKERAMTMDARPTTHPVQQKITDESQADSAFDDITYLKGQSFIRMIENYLGEDTFRDGMRRYMKAHAYSNTTTADLWKALEQASGKPVAKIAAGFTEQPGIPLVNVDSKCEDGRTVATLSQDRFTIDDPKARKLSWSIPVAIGRTGDAGPHVILLGDKPQTIAFDGCDAPVKANLGDVGYYRSAYDEASRKALAAAFKSFSPADRVNLLDDAFAMVEAGRADIGSWLDLTRQLADEKELVVWSSVAGALRTVDDLERGAPDRAAFRAYARDLLAPALNRVGWDAKPGEGLETPLLRALLIRTLGRFDDPAVVAEARRRFDALRTSPGSLDPSLEEAVVAVVGHEADSGTYQALRTLGKAAPSTEERLRYYAALGSARDPALIDESVRIAATGELPNGRVNRYLAATAAASDDPDRVWTTFLPGRKAVRDRLTEHQADALLPSMARASSNPAIADELLKLPDSNTSPGAKYEAEKAAEEIRFKAAFKARIQPALSAWLKSKAGG